MTNKKQIAPSLEDLSHAQVESSRFFGFTNASGKVLSLLSFATLGGGAIGVAQGLGYMGPVLGASLSFTGGLATLGVSVTSALIGYWLGNFDDKRIKVHNSRAAQAFQVARGSTYERIENGFIRALSNLPEYSPADNSLPYDALGHAVMMTDEKIEKLPPHVRVDVYRTQMDIELYKQRKLTSHNTVEGQEFEKKTFERPTMIEKATEYKRCRDYIRQCIADGTLVATPIGARPSKVPESSKKAHGDGADDYLLADVAVDALDALGRGLRHGPSHGAGGSIFRSGGGGDFGGGGASGSWSAAAAQNANVVSGAAQQGRAFLAGGVGSGMDTPAAASSVSDFDLGSISGSGGGSSGGFDLPDVDSDAAPLLLVVAGVAAVLAACAASGASLWKNFVSNADVPALGNVHLSLITKSLASAEKDIRNMYKPT